MSKYFTDSGELKPEYMAKIQPLLDEVDRKYNDERDLLTAAMPAKKRRYEDAKLNYERATREMQAAYIAWFSGDRGLDLTLARNKQKDKILRECLKTFSDLQEQLDIQDGTARKRQEIRTNLMRLGINSTENPFLDKPMTLRETLEREQEAEKE